MCWKYRLIVTSILYKYGKGSLRKDLNAPFASSHSTNHLMEVYWSSSLASGFIESSGEVLWLIDCKSHHCSMIASRDFGGLTKYLVHCCFIHHISFYSCWQYHIIILLSTRVDMSQNVVLMPLKIKNGQQRVLTLLYEADWGEEEASSEDVSYEFLLFTVCLPVDSMWVDSNQKKLMNKTMGA